ncbi:hypothetical protein [Mycobacterium sp. SA01]|uniref:hypothetical protein n=1 Tax=Mycobacterium sp. SA01 TaxID=3238820 RepID=UPI00351BBFE7
MNAEQIARFYSARDARTVQYGGSEQALQVTVNLIATATSTTRPGQVALLALANMVARTHRHITVQLTPAPLLAAPMIAASSIEEALCRMVFAINPAALLIINGTRTDTKEIDLQNAAQVVSVSLGGGFGDDCDVRVGWSGGRAQLSSEADVVSVGAGDADVLGAATAACLAAGAVFHLSHGREVLSCVVNLAERASAIVGPRREVDSLTPFDGVGITSVSGPLDVGDVTIIGAGAVAHGFAWWAREFGHLGKWRTVDGDIADVSNTNRCLGMSAADAGWPAGLPGAEPRAKADVLAAMIAAESVPTWFDEWSQTDPPRSDLTLILANERGVRADAASRGEPILLHATTSPSWTAELHRHLPDVDDCPACRIPHNASATFLCSTGPTEPGPESGDAALPFLSAAAGLMLTTALQQLSPTHPLLKGRHNHWRMCFERAVQLRGSVHPAHCPHTLPARARGIIQADQPRQHDQLDVTN